MAPVAAGARDPRGACRPRHHDGRVSEIQVPPPRAEESAEDRVENVVAVKQKAGDNCLSGLDH